MHRGVVPVELPEPQAVQVVVIRKAWFSFRLEAGLAGIHSRAL